MPVLTLLAEIALIVQKVNSKSGFTPQNAVKLIKSSLLLIIAAMAVRIIGMLPGLGYSTSIIAVVILVVSSVDPLLKYACPLVAPNMAQISSFIQKMESLENQLTSSVTSILDKNRPSIPVAQASFVSNRVEELPDEPHSVDEEPTLQDEGENPTIGLRKRKIA